ncbi:MULTISPECIES: hypothetical protein [unclassified Cryobacterium]|uniref:hypothetical protein n=1 Tax=unclassified Cryobacterium TaxID=2649013 RepID=UPI001124DCF1|nr:MULTISPECIES: hypothetical protein [unclassified Cryobacterium]
MARSYQDRDLKLLFGKAGFYCAFPACPNRLIEPATPKDAEAILAYIAHIVGSSDIGPRAHPGMSDKEKNSYANLLLLCGHHHPLVDKQDNSYSVGELHAWKSRLEAWVEARLTEGMRAVQFAELRVVCDSLVSETSQLGSTALISVPPADKMNDNEMTSISAYRMRLGLMQAPQVAQFIGEYATRIDSSFPGRLRAGFVAEYDRIYANGVTGDALFLEMQNFAAAGASDLGSSQSVRFEREAAGLAVLCHLFEICDVFKAPSVATA